jgi:hypothetical protein
MPTGQENKLLEDALLQLGGCTDSTTITNVDRLHVAICGPPGSWKSNTIARTARKPLLHYDFDDRKESIAGLSQVTIKTLIDRTDEEHIAWMQLENDVSVLEYLKEKNQQPFKSIALDSFTFLRQYAEHQFIADCGDLKKAKFHIGNTNYIIPRGWDAVVGVQKMLQGIIRRLFALNVDIYAVFHTKPEKDNNKTTAEKIIYKDTLTVEPENLKMLLPMFNDKWRMIYDNGKFVVQMKCNWEFAASTVLKNVNEQEDADIQKMLEKHNKNGIK